jgi:hypothetical protein
MEQTPMTLEEKKLNLWLTLRKTRALIHRIHKAAFHGDLVETVTTNIVMLGVLDEDLPLLIAEMEQDPIVAAAKASLKNLA